MTDPNYEHEFHPNRKGFCKYPLKYGTCGLTEEADVHKRWSERHPENSIDGSDRIIGREENMVRLTITKVDNGYVCEWFEDDIKKAVVFEEKDVEYGEVDCTANLLWFITEYFGVIGTKHDAKRISISTKNDEATE